MPPQEQPTHNHLFLTDTRPRKTRFPGSFAPPHQVARRVQAGLRRVLRLRTSNDRTFAPPHAHLRRLHGASSSCFARRTPRATPHPARPSRLLARGKAHQLVRRLRVRRSHPERRLLAQFLLQSNLRSTQRVTRRVSRAPPRRARSSRQVARDKVHQLVGRLLRAPPERRHIERILLRADLSSFSPSQPDKLHDLGCVVDGREVK